MSQAPGPEELPTSRDEIARFVMARKGRIQAIARTKLTKSSRSLVDSEDVVSSVMRRIDTLASRGALYVRTENDLWALITTIVGNYTVSKARLVARATRFCMTTPRSRRSSSIVLPPARTTETRRSCF